MGWVRGFFSRVIEALSGNDGYLSSTRITDAVWQIGSFCLISICVLRKIEIQEGILILIGGAIGTSVTGKVLNKKTEIKAVTDRSANATNEE